MMKKGRSEFSRSEIDEIRRLLAEKVGAPRERQKSIRDQTRSFGFYITDYDGTPRPFGPRDLDDLVRAGVVRVS